MQGNKIKKTIIIFVTILIPFIFTCCQKEEMGNVTERFLLLTNRSWRYDSHRTPGGGVYFVNYPPCIFDDSTTFKPNYEYEFKDAGITCSYQEAYELNKWEFMDNDTRLKVGDYIYDIYHLSDTMLQLGMPDDGGDYNLYYSWDKKNN